jgi:RNA polymerase sigma-70 factor (ECF subfamily)
MDPALEQPTQTAMQTEFEGQPLRAVADTQGLSLSAVKSRAGRGRNMLQAELMECCQVSLAPDGRVLDYEAGATRNCIQTDDGCKPRWQRHEPPGI